MEVEKDLKSQPSQNSGETILLVEDDQLVRNATDELLTCLGYKVLTACNGNEALEIYEQQGKQIDLVVLDLKMPVMDGKEAYHRLKSINPNVKIILSTATGEDEEVITDYDPKTCGYLRKPYLPSELASEIKRILD